MLSTGGKYAVFRLDPCGIQTVSRTLIADAQISRGSPRKYDVWFAALVMHCAQRVGASPGVRKEPAILFRHLMEGIGLALDRTGGRMFITDFAGSVYSANLDGSDQKTLLFARGNLTGIAYAEIHAYLQPEAADPLSGELAESVAAASWDSCQALIYTSGTTGCPKGVALTHAACR